MKVLKHACVCIYRYTIIHVDQPVSEPVRLAAWC